MTKFRNAVILGILVLVFIAFMDVQSMNSGVFGTPCDYVNGNYTEGWWPLFFNFNVAVMVMLALAYFFIYRKDVSEALAVFLVPFVMWWSGAADVLFFWIQGLRVPNSLPWLNNSPIVGTISNFIGNGVTNITLFASVIIGSVATFFIVKFLKEKI